MWLRGIVMRKFLILLAAGCLVLYLCGCMGFPGGTQSGSTESSRSQSAFQRKPLKIGETVILGDFEITLDNYAVQGELPDKTLIYIPENGNLYVCPRLTVTNRGTAAQTFWPALSFQTAVRGVILYQDTYEYTPSVLWGYDGDLHDTYLEPQDTAAGILIFSLPKEAADSDNLVFVLKYGRQTVRFVLKRP